MHRIDATTLKTRLRANDEMALLDVREDVDFFNGHLLFGVNVPLSRLEQMIDDLVPRPGASITVYDAGEGLADRAAARLEWLDYRNVAVLDGGVRAWQEAGGLLYSGTNVPSKAFGEYVEHAYGTPHVTAEQLKALSESGTDMVILDSRPFDEFRRMSIPGGIDCPGPELVYRVRDLAPSPDTLIVVNCAGRTRSIIGAQSLINAGVPNRVVALKDGTMGWELAGFAVASGAERRAPHPSNDAITFALAAAGQVAGRAGVERIDPSVLERFRSERDQRTLYVIDVRSAEEYEGGHLPDAVHAYGGQLVQATDRFVGVRGARLVLTDDTEVRALMTASWLRQMGWREVYVLAGGIGGQPLAKGARRPRTLGLEKVSPPTLSPMELRTALEHGSVAVVDLATPNRYRAGHVPGAWYAVRSRLPERLKDLPESETVVFTSSDGRIAKLAAAEASAFAGRNAKALDGGTAAWKAAGLPLESGAGRGLDSLDAVWSPYDDAQRTKTRMLDYLSWEVDLLEHVKQEGDARFMPLRA